MLGLPGYMQPYCRVSPVFCLELIQTTFISCSNVFPLDDPPSLSHYKSGDGGAGKCESDLDSSTQSHFLHESGSLKGSGLAL